MIAWCALIESYRRRRSRWIYAAPLLLVLWANLHGAFVATFVMLGLYAAGETLEFFQSPRVAQPRVAQGAGHLRAGRSALQRWRHSPRLTASSLYGHLWRYLGDRELLASIQEFQSPNFHSTDGKLIEIMLLLGAVAAAQAIGDGASSKSGCSCSGRI